MVLAQWKAHPAKSRPRDLALTCAVLLTTASVVLAAFQSLFLCALAIVILIFSVAAFLFPTRYALTDAGIEERRLGRARFRKWADLRRYSIGPGAALVSPFARKNWLDRYRGMILLFDGADRDAVIRIVKERVAGDSDASQ